LAARPKAARKKAILLDAAAKLYRLDIMLSLIFRAGALREEMAAPRRYVTCSKCRLLKTEIVRRRPAEIPSRAAAVNQSLLRRARRGGFKNMDLGHAAVAARRVPRAARTGATARRHFYAYAPRLT
jgi:hypothetical protein